jgi:hypothetical protein
MTENEEQLKQHAEAAKAIVSKADAEGRQLTKSERRKIDDHVDEVKKFKAAVEAEQQENAEQRAAEEELKASIDRLRASASKNTGQSGFAKAVLDAGFDSRANPRVEIESRSIFNASTLPGEETWRRADPTLAPLGQDRRFLYTNLPTENVDGVSAVHDFKQTARTLTGTPVRDLDATTDKAKVDVTLTSVVESLKQVAVTIDDIPNAIFESVNSLRAYLNSEGAFQVQKALDTHVMAQIVAAAPPFGTSGTGLVARLRNGVATMRGTGANPSIAVLNPTDSASLDLEADAGGYIFPTRDTGSSSPLWNMRVIERIGAGTEAPYLIDPQMLGQLYLGNMRFEADPITGFRKNLTTLRIETKALYHVRQAEGARRVNAT